MTRPRNIRLGYQIPNFSYPGTTEQLFDTVAAQAREAEASGFDTVLVMDHFYQLPGIGRPDEPMLEAYTTLGALAAATETIKLSTLVTGNTYRNPAMLAKTVTTLDVISKGRAVLAIGAGWYELEHDQMGYEFGTFSDRFERLEEALEIIEPMLRGRTPNLDGKWYRAHDTINQPRLRDDVPIMIGGSGERKTFRLAARYANHLNMIAGPTELPRKLEALAQRCEEVGRDRDEIETSVLLSVVIDDTPEAAAKVADDYTAAKGMSPEEAEALKARTIIGGPDQVAEQVQGVLATGVDGVIINAVVNGHVPGVVELAGKTLSPLIG